MVTIHVIMLISVPVGALAASFILPRRVATSREMLFAMLFALLPIALCGSLRHMCREGSPRMQYLIPGIVLLIVLLVVKSSGWRRLIGGTLMLAMGALTCHGQHLAHGPGWTANPGFDGNSRLSLTSARSWAKEVSTWPEYENMEFPRGWFRELPVWKHLSLVVNDEPRPRRIISRAWPTSISGLYPYELIDQDYWYPGGRFSEMSTKIEFRDRPASPD